MGSPLWGAFMAEQVRNDEVRSERQLGPVERVGPWRWYSWGYFLREPGLVLPPRCACFLVWVE